MKKHFLVYSFLLYMGLYACTTPNEQAASTPVYYDLKGYISNQILALKQRKPLVVKQMMVGNTADSIQTTELDWDKELELFLQADLNKQAYVASYTATQPNPQTTLYELKAGESLPVKSLKIVLNSQIKQPERIEVQMTEENKLYDSAKTLILNCAMRPEGVWLVKDYEISGFQHLTLTDKKVFRVKGTVR